MKRSKIWNELGNTYFKFGDLEKAIDAYRNAIANQTEAFGTIALRDSGLSYSSLASVLVKQGKYYEAVPLYQKSLELIKDQKEQASIWGSLGSIYHHLNEHGKAIQAFQKADELMPMVVTGKLGEAASQDIASLGNNVDAWGENIPGKPSNTVVELSPTALGGEKTDQENPSVWNELGLVLFKVGSYEDAIDAFIKAIELDPTIGYFYCNLGQVLVSQGRLQDAIELFEKSLELFQNNLDKSITWNRLGDIYRQLGLMNESQAAYKLTEVLTSSVLANQNEYRVLDLNTIINENGQIRDQLSLDSLVESIRIHGVIQPLVVCPKKNEPGKYTVIVGKRRLEAARRAGLQEIPAIVRLLSEQEMLELSINENIHNAAMSPFDLASDYRQLSEINDLSMDEIAVRVGRSWHSVANTMKALDEGQVSILNEQKKDDRIQVQFGLPIAPGKTLIDTLHQNNYGYDQNSVDPVRYAQQNARYLSGENTAVEVSTEVGTHHLASPHVDATPVLWYLEAESVQAEVNTATIYSHNNASLLERARDALKSNPHTKRQTINIKATASYQA